MRLYMYSYFKSKGTNMYLRCADYVKLEQSNEETLR